jgi:thiamine-monophosphate kinase
MFENKDNRTEISSIGEFGLIEHLNGFIQCRNPSTIKGIGDDAAVIDHGTHLEVLTNDLLVEGVHFDLTYAPLKHLGYKAVMVNLSDVFAMNATPSQITVGLALSNRFSLEAVEELYQGMLLACNRFGVDLVGGDTSSSLTGLVISITATGRVTKEEIAYRSNAQVNDLICVSGNLGAAYIGLQILNREKKVYMENPGVQPDLEGNDYVLERQLKPEARGDIIQDFRSKSIVPTSMIDISDGLASELMHICKNSSKGCRIYENKIPIDPQTVSICEELNLNPTVCALNGGEDYELLFTIKQADFEKVKELSAVSVIGHVTEESAGLAMVDAGDHEIPLKARGWDSLNPSDQE